MPDPVQLGEWQACHQQVSDAIARLEFSFKKHPEDSNLLMALLFVKNALKQLEKMEVQITPP